MLALNSWLYKNQGLENDGYVQQLMAHKEAKMTEEYQKSFSKNGCAFGQNSTNAL